MCFLSPPYLIFFQNNSFHRSVVEAEQKDTKRGSRSASPVLLLCPSRVKEAPVEWPRVSGVRAKRFEEVVGMGNAGGGGGRLFTYGWG